MLSWSLWRALSRPPKPSPLYRRAYARQGPTDSPISFRIPLFSTFRNLSLVVLPVVLILLGAPILVLLYYLALMLAPLLLPVANTIYGLSHANSASSSIVREREQQTYDVLCTAPAGSLGMHWSYCTGWIHYHWLWRYALLGVLSIGIVASVFGLSSQLVFGSEQAPLAVAIIRTVALGALFVIDYAQTPILSSLTTLIVPTYTFSQNNARLWATSLFLLLQATVYVPTLLLALYALPNTFALMRLDPLLADVLTPLLLVAFFAALRELMIAGLWHTVKEQLGATSLELDAITRLAV